MTFSRARPDKKKLRMERRTKSIEHTPALQPAKRAGEAWFGVVTHKAEVG